MKIHLLPNVKMQRLNFEGSYFDIIPVKGTLNTWKRKKYQSILKTQPAGRHRSDFRKEHAML